MMSNSSFLKGAAILTITMFLTKIMGFIYVIPFTKLVGTQGYILFEYAYKPYAIMIALATIGIPQATSKFVSKYNELGDYETGRRLLKSGVIILTITGLIWTSILYFSSPLIASWLIDENQKSGNTLADVQFVIEMISFALLVVPMMAIVRGFFQGYQKSNPTAISQLVEQIVRIAIILIGSYVIVSLLNGEVKTAVGVSTFAAFISALASILVLYFYWRKYRTEFQEKWKSQKESFAKPSLAKIYKELLYSSIPFAIISLAVPIYQNIDIFSINPTLIAKGMTQAQAELSNSLVALVQKITTIPIIFANAFALTLVPAITQSYISKNKENMTNQITKSIQIIFFLTLPLSIAFMVLPNELYGVLLGTEYAIQGGVITEAYAFSSVILSFFILTSSILQGLNKQAWAVFSFILGMLVKLLISVSFITWFEGSGTSYSTMIGFGVSTVINLYVIKTNSSFSVRRILCQAGTVIWVSLITAVVMWVTKHISHFVFRFDSTYVEYLVVLVVSGMASAITYLSLSHNAGLIKELLWNKDSKKELKESV